MQILKLIPLLYLHTGDILAYKYGNFFILDQNTYAVKDKITLSLGWKEKYLSRIGLIGRLLRLGIRNAHQIDDKTVVFFVNKRLYEYHIEKKQIIEGFIPPSGIRALNIISINEVTGFDDMVVFGGYLSNINKEEVSIYKRVDCRHWEPIYTFKQGVVNHIHNLIPDQKNGCVWILSGDFDNAAAIWKATNNFRIVEPVVSGTQNSRSCVAFPVDRGLLYATDTPFYLNSICLLEKVNNTWKSTKIMDIAGSCIYGCRIGENFVFSTTVEPDGRDTGISSLFKFKRGKGISDCYAHLYIGTLEKGFQEIYKVKKDIWFPVLFQFGTLKFPAGINRTKELLAEHVATKNYSGKTVVIKINN